MSVIFSSTWWINLIPLQNSRLADSVTVVILSFWRRSQYRHISWVDWAQGKKWCLWDPDLCSCVVSSFDHYSRGNMNFLTLTAWDAVRGPLFRVPIPLPSQCSHSTGISSEMEHLREALNSVISQHWNRSGCINIHPFPFGFRLKKKCQSRNSFPSQTDPFPSNTFLTDCT